MRTLTTLLAACAILSASAIAQDEQEARYLDEINSELVYRNLPQRAVSIHEVVSSKDLGVPYLIIFDDGSRAAMYQRQEDIYLAWEFLYFEAPRNEQHLLYELNNKFLGDELTATEIHLATVSDFDSQTDYEELVSLETQSKIYAATIVDGYGHSWTNVFLRSSIDGTWMSYGYWYRMTH